MKKEWAFTAREISTFSADRLYRVYFADNSLYFVKVGGQDGVARGAATQFGLLGALFFWWWEKRAKERLRQRLAADDHQNLRELIARDGTNYQVPVGQIRSSVIEPAAMFGGYGPHEGVWRFEDTSGKKHVLQFEGAEDMKEAITRLAVVLGAVFSNQVEWSPAKKRFIKRSGQSV